VDAGEQAARTWTHSGGSLALASGALDLASLDVGANSSIAIAGAVTRVRLDEVEIGAGSTVYVAAGVRLELERYLGVPVERFDLAPGTLVWSAAPEGVTIFELCDGFAFDDQECRVGVTVTDDGSPATLIAQGGQFFSFLGDAAGGPTVMLDGGRLVVEGLGAGLTVSAGRVLEVGPRGGTISADPLLIFGDVDGGELRIARGALADFDGNWQFSDGARLSLSGSSADDISTLELAGSLIADGTAIITLDLTGATAGFEATVIRTDAFEVVGWESVVVQEDHPTLDATLACADDACVLTVDPA
jgi:hypothetical protein